MHELADYTATYVERDVRQVVNVGDLPTFFGFIKLCAGRTAQEIAWRDVWDILYNKQRDQSSSCLTVSTAHRTRMTGQSSAPS